MDFTVFFEEMIKTGAISDEEAEHALRRYRSLKDSRPDPAQVARYGALGAVVGPGVSAIGNVIKGEPHAISLAEHYRGSRGLTRAKGTGRSVAASAVTGAIGMGAVPIARHWMDRSAERHKLKRYLQEHDRERREAPEAT